MSVHTQQCANRKLFVALKCLGQGLGVFLLYRVPCGHHSMQRKAVMSKQQLRCRACRLDLEAVSCHHL